MILLLKSAFFWASTNKIKTSNAISLLIQINTCVGIFFLMLNKYLLINWYQWKSRKNKESTEENHAVSMLMQKKKKKRKELCAAACLVTPQRKLMFKENKKMETSKKYQVPSLAKCTTSLIMLLGDLATLGLQRNGGKTTGTSQSDLVVVYFWPIRLDY